MGPSSDLEAPIGDDSSAEVSCPWGTAGSATNVTVMPWPVAAKAGVSAEAREEDAVSSPSYLITPVASSGAPDAEAPGCEAGVAAVQTLLLLLGPFSPSSSLHGDLPVPLVM